MRAATMQSSVSAMPETTQRGFTLVEIMIAMTMALFLLAGLMTIVSSTRNVFGKQNQLTLLQDNERMALTIIADVIQQAGYYPSPTTNLSTIVPTPITGTYSAAAPGDTISVAYETHSAAAGVTDGVLNCSGLPNSTGGDVLYTNIFSVSAGQLVCTMNGTAYPLVNGVQNLSILYGVRSGLSSSTCATCVDTYLNATQVSAAVAWPNVKSVQIALTLTNPLYSPGADQQPQTITIQRVVTVMNQSGVTL